MDIDERLHCPACGYNLRGLADGLCPECGIAFKRAELAKLDRPTVSVSAIYGFALAWPLIFLVVVAPLAILISILISLLFEIVLNRSSLANGLGWLTFSCLTLVVCYPVCKDLARQTAFQRRLKQTEAGPVSLWRLVLLYFFIELGLISALMGVVYMAWLQV